MLGQNKKIWDNETGLKSTLMVDFGLGELSQVVQSGLRIESGRWESNPNGRLSKAYEMHCFLERPRLRAIGVRILAL